MELIGKNRAGLGSGGWEGGGVMCTIVIMGIMSDWERIRGHQ